VFAPGAVVFKGSSNNGRKTGHNIKQHAEFEIVGAGQAGYQLVGAGSAGRGRDHKGRTCASRMGGGSSE
jgi:hypothetical protein